MREVAEGAAEPSWRDPQQPWVRAMRLILAAIAIGAVITNIVRAFLGVSTNTPIEVLSQYTNLSCLLFCGVAIASALVPRERLPGWWDALRGCAAFALVMTGLIYALLVAKPGELGRWDLSWWNLAQHRLLPVMALLDWLVVRMAVRGRWTRPLWWLLYPLSFLGYTWARGAVAKWYPYGFLDPTREGGWPVVLRTTGLVLLAFFAVAAVVHLLGSRLAAPRAARARSMAPSAVAPRLGTGDGDPPHPDA